MAKILIIEDEAPLAETLAYNLREEGHEVVLASDGLAGLDRARGEHPDLVILDLMLPKMDGLEVCRLIRRDSDVPIIMLTAKSREVDKVVGLELGADDYVTKPFSMVEMLARVKAALRRARVGRREETLLKAGTLEMDIPRHTVKIEGREIILRPREFELLRILLVNRGTDLSIRTADHLDNAGIARSPGIFVAPHAHREVHQHRLMHVSGRHGHADSQFLHGPPVAQTDGGVL